MSLKDSKVFSVITSGLEASSILVFVAAVLNYDEGILWGFFEPFGLIGILAFGVLCGLIYIFAIGLLVKIFSVIYDAFKSE
jgi:hypothetical protein